MREGPEGRPLVGAPEAEVEDDLETQQSGPQPDLDQLALDPVAVGGALGTSPPGRTAGVDDVEAGGASFRYRAGRQDNGVPVDEAIARVAQAVADRVQV